jgi:phenylphosphate carboxylase gamma subunit
MGLRIEEKKNMAREYDTFILSDLATLPEDQEMELIIRDLTPADRRYKYRSAYVSAMISKSESKYPDRLWIRLGRGQLQEKPWSIKILKELNKST